MEYKDYSIQIKTEKKVIDTVTFEGNVKMVSPNTDHMVFPGQLTITIKYNEHSRANGSDKNQRQIFYSIEDMEAWINGLINSCTNADANFRKFITWLNSHIDTARKMNVAKS